MKCLEIEKLSQYVDKIVSKEEHSKINNHLLNCFNCRVKVESLIDEQQFIQDNLGKPTLPDHFASMVIDQLQPYFPNGISNKKRALRKKILLPAAGVILVLSLSTTLNPALSNWVDGIFSSSQVDEGLRIANEKGFTTKLNQEVTDKGITFKVDEMVADSSRLTFSFQILDHKQKVKTNHFDTRNGKNKIILMDKNGGEIKVYSTSWSNQKDYGLMELNLRDTKIPKDMIIKFDLGELDGKEGNWQLEVPVDVSKSLLAIKTVSLNNASVTKHGIILNMEEVRFAPSSNELIYETQFTEEELKEYTEEIKNLEDKFGNKDAIRSWINLGNNLQYHIEDEDGKTILYKNAFVKENGFPSDFGVLKVTGNDEVGGEVGHKSRIDSFVPQKNNRKLTFVLDGILRTEPTDFSLKIKPKEIANKPVSFEYEGNHFTIKQADQESKISLQKSLFPLKKETALTIEMVGSRKADASRLDQWVITDNNGKSYSTSSDWLITDQKDENGRYKSTITLQTKEINELPNELNLNLILVTRSYPLDKEWRLPLY
ncbi:DUF4179 domain-containing protein [Bacillus sp. CGMCC 1.16607]|uniref:DUF4179 domain-containing protein n=1 Tax=Bacillus sp. CGMCC 1.16607 TaxID=3351842 RepID=UPI003630FF96